MGYFYGKSKSTAESVSGALTNVVKSNLGAEKHRYDSELKSGEVPVFPIQNEGAEFSGNGVDEVKKIVEECYYKYNTHYRYKVREAQEKRKTLFNHGGE